MQVVVVISCFVCDSGKNKHVNDLPMFLQWTLESYYASILYKANTRDFPNEIGY